MDILIADSKEEAMEQEAIDAASIKIFTDGSSQNGFVGASAMLYYPQKGILINLTRIMQCQLGLDTKYSAWEAEAAGVVMALWAL